MRNMPKLLQINVVSNVLSTGKIAEGIGEVAIVNGWESYIAYGRNSKRSRSREYRIGSMFDVYVHYVEHKLFDREGLSSISATKNLLKQIVAIQPDIIQLHNIHDHYINYPILFNFLAGYDKPVIWVQHDCWAFTGGCMYFDMTKCEKWKEKCNNCVEQRAIFCNKSEKHFAKKKELLSKIRNLTFIPVSDWLAGLIGESVQSYRDVVTIHNGVDLSKFRPMLNNFQKSKFRILGVASVWSERKGFNDFLKLDSLLPNEFEIILVGLSPKQVKMLPNGIKGITRTTNIEELVSLYSSADVFVNPTYSDNFPTVNIEALACGTPVITYKTGGSPEAIDEKTGVVIEQGDIEALAKAIIEMKEQPLSSEDCRKRAEELFDKDKCFQKYIDLYNEILSKNK